MKHSCPNGYTGEKGLKMGNVKLMPPLFHDRNFNREGRKMKSVFLKEVSNGTDTFRLWHCVGKPDISYPQAENDRYVLYVEINGYLVPLNMREFFLIKSCGRLPAIEKLYGGEERRNEYFENLRKDGQPDWEGFTTARERESSEILHCGSAPLHQADHIRKILDGHMAAYLASKENGGRTFPDFIGALMLDDLSNCVGLSARHKGLLSREKEERLAEKRRADVELVQSGNVKAAQAVQAALETMRHGGTLENERIRLFTLTPEGYTVSEYSIVNYLMRQFSIDVPLRTQGWINDKLIRVRIKDERSIHVTFFRRNREKGSQKFFDCMWALIHAVRKEGKS